MNYSSTASEAPYDLPAYWCRNDHDRRFWHVNFTVSFRHCDVLQWFDKYPVFKGVTDDFGNLVRVQ